MPGFLVIAQDHVQGVVDAEADEQHREGDRDQVEIAHRHRGEPRRHEDADQQQDEGRDDKARAGKPKKITRLTSTNDTAPARAAPSVTVRSSSAFITASPVSATRTVSP
jgi:hypothetical protein